MVDLELAEACFARLREAYPNVTRIAAGRALHDSLAIDALHGGAGARAAYASITAEEHRAISHAQSELSRIYSADVSGGARLGYDNDVRFLRDTLSGVARVLGEKSLENMRGVRQRIWNRYLHTSRQGATDENGQDRGPELTGGNGINAFARALACFLVYRSSAPFPVLPEDRFRMAELPPDPPTIPAIPLPGGLDDSDAGTPRPNTEGGWELPQAWVAWGQGTNRGRSYATSLLNEANPDEVKRKLFDPEAGGHPLLLLVPKFRTPEQIYMMLRLDDSGRTPFLRALIREIEQFLLGAERSFESALTARDWETLRPTLIAAVWHLFPNNPDGASPDDSATDAPLHALGTWIIDHELIGWTLRDFAMLGAFGISLGLSLATLGASAPAVIAALEVAIVAIDLAAIGLDLALIVSENEERARINRYAQIDHCLNIAEDPESVSAALALSLMALLLPPVIASGARRAIRTVRARVLREALADLPREAVPGFRAASSAPDAAPRPRHGTERATARPESGRPLPRERTTTSAEAAEARRPGAASTEPTPPEPTPLATPATSAADSLPTSDVIDDLNIDDAFDSIVGDGLPPGASSASSAGTDLMMVLTREQEAALGQFLGRNWNDLAPRHPPGSAVLTSAQRAAWARADQRARETLLGIRRHWDAALPPRVSSVDDVVRRIFARRPSGLSPSEYNRWFRSALFGNWRQRAMRRIWNDTALRDQLREMGLTIYWRRGRSGRYVGSFRIRARRPDGARVHIGLDVDHGVIGHSPAVREAIAHGAWQPLVTTVDSTNMQLITASENQQVIEELRRLARIWL